MNEAAKEAFRNNQQKSDNDSPNIFKKSTIDRYTDRPNSLITGRKYSALDNFC